MFVWADLVFLEQMIKKNTKKNQLTSTRPVGLAAGKNVQESSMSRHGHIFLSLASFRISPSPPYLALTSILGGLGSLRLLQGVPQLAIEGLFLAYCLLMVSRVNKRL